MTAGVGPLLSGQQVLVVGTGAMGRATAALAAAHGASVTLAGRHPVTDPPARTTVVTADCEDPDQARDLLARTAPLDHLALLAGGSGAHATSITATGLLDAQRAFGRFWTYYNVLHAAPGHVTSGGSITVLSGSSGRRPVAGLGIWGTLHGAIEALARNAVLELAPVRVNTVSPGGIGMQPDRQLVDHRGGPDDIAAMVVALMTNPAVTATVVDVDGGERLGP